LRGGLIVGVVVPADVLAGEVVAIAPVVHDIPDHLSGRRDVMAEVAAVFHVLAAESSNRSQGGVDAKGRQAGAVARLVGRAVKLLLGRAVEAVRVPGKDRA